MQFRYLYRIKALARQPGCKPLLGFTFSVHKVHRADQRRVLTSHELAKVI